MTKKKVKVKAVITAIAWIGEDDCGYREIEDFEEITDVLEFQVIEN